MNELRTTLDTGKETYMALKCKQNDDRTLILTLLSNGVVWIPEVGSILELRGKRSDSTVTIQTTTGITITNNVVTIALSKEFTKIQGTVELELNIRKLTEITTFTFILVIEPSVIQDGAIVSENTSSVLEELKDIIDWGNEHLVDKPAYRVETLDEMNSLVGIKEGDTCVVAKYEVSRLVRVGDNLKDKTIITDNLNEIAGIDYWAKIVITLKDMDSVSENMSIRIHTVGDSNPGVTYSGYNKGYWQETVLSSYSRTDKVFTPNSFSLKITRNLEVISIDRDNRLYQKMYITDHEAHSFIYTKGDWVDTTILESEIHGNIRKGNEEIVVYRPDRYNLEPFVVDDVNHTITLTMKTYDKVIPIKQYEDTNGVNKLYDIMLDDEVKQKISNDYIFKLGLSNINSEPNSTTSYKTLKFNSQDLDIPVAWFKSDRVFYISKVGEVTTPISTSVYADIPSGFRKLKVTGDIDGIRVYMNDVYPIQVKVGFQGAGIVSFRAELNRWSNSFAPNLNQLAQHQSYTNELCILHNVKNISVEDISSTAKTWLDSMGCTKYKNRPTLGEYMMVSYGGKALEYIGTIDTYGTKGYILDKESVSLMAIQPNADLSTLSTVATTGSYNDLIDKPTLSIATTTANGLMSSADKTKLDGVKAGANKVVNSTTNGNILIDNVETKVYTHPIGTNPHGTTKADIGLGNVDNTKDLNKPISTATQTALNGKINTSQKGVANGVAQLNSNGVVPSSQLPSYVDDVLEYSSNALFPSTGESGKIYINTTTNLTYRWTGSGYAEISPSIALGETSSTAYAGDKGRATTDKVNGHIGNTSHITSTERTNWNSASTNNHTHSNKSVLDGTTASYTTTEKNKLSGIATGANNYTHPASHSPSIIAQDSNNRFVTDAEKSSWNGKATQSTIDASISNIQIGGRNLLRNGANFKNTDYWVLMLGSIDTVNTYLGGNTIKAAGNQTLQHQTIRLKPNTYYVWSYVAKATVATFIGVENAPVHIQIWTDENPSNRNQEISTGDFNATISKDNWSNCYRVFKTPNSATWVYMIPFVYRFGANAVNFTNFQVEEGNKPTDWTPAPEDVDSAIALKADKTTSGTTATRPTPTYTGEVYFDTDLGKPIWCKTLSPAVWVDSVGTTV